MGAHHLAQRPLSHLVRDVWTTMLDLPRRPRARRQSTTVLNSPRSSWETTVTTLGTARTFSRSAQGPATASPRTAVVRQWGPCSLTSFLMRSERYGGASAMQ